MRQNKQKDKKNSFRLLKNNKVEYKSEENIIEQLEIINSQQSKIQELINSSTNYLKDYFLEQFGNDCNI